MPMFIATERLSLHEFTMGDVASLHALESIPEVVRYQSYGPRGLREAEAYVRDVVAAQRETPRRHIELAVLQHDRFLGRVGALIDGGEATVWYAFMPSAQGRGFATEAARAFIRVLDASRLTIECDPRNVASWRLAERLGFERASLEERAYENKGEWVGSAVYRREREISERRVGIL